jgi:hypothetical protein
MTPTQYRTAIAKLGLSQRGAAAFLKIGERTSRRWALGESPIPEGYAMLLRLMVRLNLTPVDVD